MGQQGYARNLKEHNQPEKLFVKNKKYTKKDYYGYRFEPTISICTLPFNKNTKHIFKTILLIFEKQEKEKETGV